MTKKEKGKIKFNKKCWEYHKDNILIEGLGNNYLMPSFQLFLFSFQVKTAWTFEYDTFTSVTEHCPILSFIDFCFVCFL